jgi:hypothetical protein
MAEAKERGVAQRAIAMWVIGSICVFFGALIAGTIEPTVLGASPLSVAVSFLISFILILVGGMFWITVAVIREEEGY